MEKSVKKRHSVDRKKNFRKNIILPGYPIYPESEDIYHKGIEETEIDPEQITEIKTGSKYIEIKELDFEEFLSSDDLDIPGVELDHDLEQTGNEDEENDYYSLGGENHIDLEENIGN